MNNVKLCPYKVNSSLNWLSFIRKEISNNNLSPGDALNTKKSDPLILIDKI